MACCMWDPHLYYMPYSLIRAVARELTLNKKRLRGIYGCWAHTHMHVCFEALKLLSMVPLQFQGMVQTRTHLGMEGWAREKCRAFIGDDRRITLDHLQIASSRLWITRKGGQVKIIRVSLVMIHGSFWITHKSLQVGFGLHVLQHQLFCVLE